MFKVDKDIKITAKSLTSDEYKIYNYADLSKSVAYFVDKLSQHSDKDTIGVAFTNLSFLSVAFALALQKCKNEFILVYHQNFNFEEKKKHCSHLYITGYISETFNGEPLKRKIQALDRRDFTLTDAKSIEESCLNYHREENLDFEFRSDRKTYSLITDQVNVLYPTGKIEASCISAAIKNYFHPDDVCLLLRPFQHLGVGTLSIYPALFSTKNILLCSNDKDWINLYKDATHVHMSIDFIQNRLPLPEKIRMLTTGGYNFNSECLEYVRSQSEIENIVDCFGTAVLPPPLAIRRFIQTEHDSHWTAFEWINDYIKFNIVDDQLALSSADGDIFNDVPYNQNGKIIVRDRVENASDHTGEKFNFYGSFNVFVRMSHIRYDHADFIQTFKKHSNIDDVDVEYELVDNIKNPIVVVPQEYLSHAISIGKQFAVEAKFKSK